MPARNVSIPSPTGGWNTRDSLDEMDPTDAVVLDNWIPGRGKCTVRNGYESHATGVGTAASNVDFIAEYHAGSTQKLLAASPDKLYDATAASAASVLSSGYSSGQWQHANFNGVMLMVNGADLPQKYDGTNVSAVSYTMTGSTATSLIGVNVFKSRLYFWEDNSQDFWYGAVNAVTGTLTKFPLSRVGQFGGNLVTMSTWTLDDGAGADDLAVFAMSSGEVIVYQGSDPGSSTDWALIGVYRIGAPMGIRSFVKSAGDLVVATTDDYVSLSAVLRTGQVGNASKLSGAALDASASVSAGTFGYQSLLYKSGNLIIFNVPQSDGTFHQHVINTLTGGGCRFTDIPARCWGVYNNALYFGSTDGTVYKYTGTDDNGSAILADGAQAWNDFGIPQRKRLCAVRPSLKTNGSIDYEIGVGFDYSDANVSSPSTTSSTGPFWDSAYWDVDYWAAEDQVDLTWKVRGGTGQTLSPRLKINAQQASSWLRTDLRVEVGKNL